ncbi:maleylpyruvate isomerase family mycothiol-dependent enzyme [Streptomyces radiopugnans]|uniref:TIGR03083 family protein n=1 Tax=Streptomyces radiopugnans TaxID=403935 RepID=A0A1H9KS71_9ACTN|nr:maleylpyruvate isomerase family mycothiol-dependent enzyme [Streptomyces radiopugnans]SER02021.1 TIGR03083 family protein [Streptomyces radiopugnans]
MSETRDPWLPHRLLLSERDALLPLLRHTAESEYERRTACPGWTVREVLAHCSAALLRIVEGRLEGAFTPEANASDVRERRDWSVSRILDELEEGFTEAGKVIAASDGDLDVIALGEWVHAGDVRDALGRPGAYEGPGAAEALAILTVASRVRSTPRVEAVLGGGGLPVPETRSPASPASPTRRLSLGNLVEGRPPARLETDVPTLVRLYSGRPVVGARYVLDGAEESELVIYG